MNRQILDLNMDQPVLAATLPDEARTEIEIELPDEALINELQNMGPELERIKTGDPAGVAQCYALVAKLMSYNTDGIQFTADDLRGKYNMRLVPMIRLVKAYMDFIDQVSNLKN